MQYGVFDHLDDGGGDPTAFYEDRLRLIEAYDAAGLRGYHIAEHHATPLGMAPSPSVFLAAAIQRSRNLRLGPMVYCLPLYHPLRLLEEICMLDQMSGGRLELGVGRGISPIEVGYFGLHEDEGVAVYREALELILKGLANPRLTYAGQHYRITNMPVTLHPVQRPHPPLWYGVARPESTIWPAQNRVNIVTNRDCAAARGIMDRYRDERAAAGITGGPEPLLGMTRHIVIARNEKDALASARRAYRVWHHSFHVLWQEHGMVPPNVSLPPAFDDLRAQGLGIAGTPQQVREEIARQAEAAGINYLLCRFAFGDLSHDESRRSVDLFAEHVIGA
jgi:alkanesulfonate monooxygenase SsuD/methylene tetrahydromethanopterin reductase-like flavin-dependent oxidoreductase (luciferase family)